MPGSRHIGVTVITSPTCKDHSQQFPSHKHDWEMQAFPKSANIFDLALNNLEVSENQTHLDAPVSQSA